MNGALGRFGSFRRLYVDCIGTVAFHRCCRTQEFPKQSVSEHGLGGQPSASSRAIDGTLIHRRVTAMEAYPPPGLLSSSCTTQAGGWGRTLGGGLQRRATHKPLPRCGPYQAFHRWFSPRLAVRGRRAAVSPSPHIHGQHWDSTRHQPWTGQISAFSCTVTEWPANCTRPRSGIDAEPPSTASPLASREKQPRARQPLPKPSAPAFGSMSHPPNMAVHTQARTQSRLRGCRV